MNIPFYARYHAKLEQEALLACLEGSLATDGLYSSKALSQLSSVYPGKSCWLSLTASCSLALETALTLRRLAP